jgi:hypothetical protein
MDWQSFQYFQAKEIKSTDGTLQLKSRSRDVMIEGSSTQYWHKTIVSCRMGDESFLRAELDSHFIHFSPQKREKNVLTMPRNSNNAKVLRSRE